MGSTPLSGSRQRAWFRALDHARLTGVKPFWRIGDYYTVDSPRSGGRYTIGRTTVEGALVYSCTCPAAHAGRVCWHRELVAALPYERAIRAGRPYGTESW